jgi:exodeoxyribonuclease V alpha subunit
MVKGIGPHFAKMLVTIIGQPQALAMAVKNRKSNRRLTNLAVRIAGV